MGNKSTKSPLSTDKEVLLPVEVEAEVELIIMEGAMTSAEDKLLSAGKEPTISMIRPHSRIKLGGLRREAQMGYMLRLKITNGSLMRMSMIASLMRRRSRNTDGK